MIIKIFNKRDKIGEIFQKGNVFSYKLTSQDRAETSYLEKTINVLKKEESLLVDFTRLPGDYIKCKLGRSEIETFLILDNGIQGFQIEMSGKPIIYNPEVKGVLY